MNIFCHLARRTSTEHAALHWQVAPVKLLPLRSRPGTRNKPEISISRAFCANVRCSRWPGPWPGAKAGMGPGHRGWHCRQGSLSPDRQWEASGQHSESRLVRLAAESAFKFGLRLLDSNLKVVPVRAFRDWQGAAAGSSRCPLAASALAHWPS